jgi:signal transduction histidine kinase
MVVIPLVLILSYVLPAATGIFAFTEFGVTPMVFLVGALYYSVVRHQLFDIRRAAVRTVGYTLTVAAMAGIYILLAYGMSIVFFGGTVTDGVGLSPANIVIALVLAFIFQPIKLFFDKLTNRIFYRGQYSQSAFLREFGKIISHDTDLFLLLQQTSAYIGKTLSAEKAFFYVNNRGVIGRYNTEQGQLPEHTVALIEKWFEAQKETDEVMVYSAAGEDEQRLLASHKVQAVVRLIVGSQVLGYLFIGDHKGRGYAPRDVHTLGMVSNELAIAMQNALSVEEVRDLNSTLKQRVENATRDLRDSNRQLQELDKTKDEFISMASHQLRTPLTSIKGYLDMVLDGDMGDINDTQRTALTEAYMSSERMVSLINDFLNVSRLQTGKFIIDKHAIDLASLLKEQTQMLSVMASQHNISMSVAVAPDVPTVLADGGKIQQVMLNMMDNALYYSKPDTTIHITLKKEGDRVEFTVKDTGIGVPESEKAGLFGKFFRASNARKRRPDGTGVGLFLAKKVIAEHGGEMI